MISEAYSERINEIRKAFYSNKDLPSIQLYDFLDKKSYDDLKKKISKLKLARKTQAMQYSFSEAEFEFDKEIIDFVQSILKKKIQKTKLLCFEWKDYTILNDEVLEKPGIDVIFDITDDWNENCGGSIVYVDGNGEYTKITPSGNTLIIVERKKNTQKFVKYINHLAQKKRCFMIAEFS